eukprot:1620850-Rhodomonas_salina.2
MTLCVEGAREVQTTSEMKRAGDPSAKWSARSHAAGELLVRCFAVKLPICRPLQLWFACEIKGAKMEQTEGGQVSGNGLMAQGHTR